ncbi:MAG: oligosaccharide flippase family protein [Pseudomonadota bacterium]
MAPRLLLDSLWVLGTRILMRIANFLVLMILARALPLEAFGTYGLAVATLLMLSFMLDFGVRQSSAVALGLKDADPDLPTHLAAATAICAFLAMVAAFVVMQSIAGSDGDRLTWIVALIAVPVMILRCLQGAQLGLGRLDQLNLSEFLPRALTLLGVVVLWPLGLLNLESAMIVTLVGYWVGAAYLIAVSNHLLSWRRRLSGVQLGTLFRQGLVFAGSAIAMILLGRVSIWIIGAIAGTADVGLYFAILRLSELPVEVAGAIGVALFSHGVRQTKGASSGADTARAVRSVNFLLIIGVAWMAWFAEPMLRLSFGANFAAHTELFHIMLLGTVVSCMNMMIYPCLASNGRARVGLLAYGPGMFTAAALTWILTPLYGLPGAAVAVLLAKVWVLTVLVIAFLRRFEVPLASLLIPSVEDFKPLLARAAALPSRLRSDKAPTRRQRQSDDIEPAESVEIKVAERAPAQP